MKIRLREAQNHWCSFVHPGSIRRAYPLKDDSTPDMTQTVTVQHQGCIGPACASWRWTRAAYRTIPGQGGGPDLLCLVEYVGFCSRTGPAYELEEYDFHDDQKAKPAGNLTQLLSDRSSRRSTTKSRPTMQLDPDRPGYPRCGG